MNRNQLEFTIATIRSRAPIGKQGNRAIRRMTGSVINAENWQLRDSIIAELAPKLSDARRASLAGDRLEDDARELSRPGRPIGSTGGQTRTQKHGSHLAKYQFAFGMVSEVSPKSDDYGMQDNCPLWEMGNALIERDNAAK